MFRMREIDLLLLPQRVDVDVGLAQCEIVECEGCRDRQALHRPAAHPWPARSPWLDSIWRRICPHRSASQLTVALAWNRWMSRMLPPVEKALELLWLRVADRPVPNCGIKIRGAGVDRRLG